MPVRLTLSEKAIVLAAVGAVAIVASAGQLLTGIPAYLVGAALAVPAMIIVKRLTAGTRAAAGGRPFRESDRG
jgi:hypothetical protein